MENLSKEAIAALIRLEGGAKFNCIHSTARELITAGMAFDGWGALEITETGRRVARLHRGIEDRDPMSTPVNSHFELAPLAPVDRAAEWSRASAMAGVSEDGSVVPERGGGIDRTPNPHWTNSDEGKQSAPQTDSQKLTWSRDQARAAAGVANAKCGVWIEAIWVEAFMDAYEEI